MYLMSHRGEPKAEPVLIGTAIPNSVQKGQEFTAPQVCGLQRKRRSGIGKKNLPAEP